MAQYDSSKGGFELYRSDDGLRRLTFGGAVFGRYAYWNWFEGPSGDNEYSYEFQRTRLHLKYSATKWTAFFEPQYVTMWNVPDDAFKAPPEGPLRMGGCITTTTTTQHPGTLASIRHTCF